ncbi:MAG: FAD-dependent oxidoreductase [Chloroflexi bacterium]|nr:FAD-dependent oxidoreductase [Chloroflexota bacterium]MDL1940996.1 FAD-binding oxidoreductase [Chloroflexi bacterium CFX2]
MKQHVYWHTTAQMPDDSNLSPIPAKADVAIIGGGYTGLSAARMLAKRNINVAVLEANTIGWGASSRNGGMTLTGLKPAMQTVIKKYGRELAKELFQCSLDSVNIVEQIIKEENIDCGFARRGHLLAANKPKHYDALQDEVEFMAKEFNHSVRLVSPEDLRTEIGTDVYHGALVDEVSGGLNPAQYVAGLAAAAARAGAKLCARARVNRLERGEKRFFIQTERGNLEAESVLVATSGYTGGITKNLQKKIIPIGSFIIATERLSDELANKLSPKNRMIFDYKHFLNYFRLWDNRLIFGGRAAFFPENKNTIAQSGEILRREMIRVYPQLKDVKVEYVWGGTLDFAFDQMTHVGEEDGIYYSLGYAGHGVAMATYLGATVAEAMMKGNIKEHPFARFDFPGAPFGLYNGNPWFLPFAGMWYRILDWIE